MKMVIITILLIIGLVGSVIGICLLNLLKEYQERLEREYDERRD